VTTRKKVRVRKARASGRMPCGHVVQRGEKIISRQGGAWTCLACAGRPQPQASQ
jgi:hypothetical protein